ncbi:hypothetical protein ACLOJK_021033 [Asimina triloba]
MMEYPWASLLGSGLASLMLLWLMAHRYLPPQLQSFVSRTIVRLFSIFDSYIDIKIHEYMGERLHRSPAYSVIQAYLMATTAKHARWLTADQEGKGSDAYVVVDIDDNEQVTDHFRGAKLWWTACSRLVSTQSISFYPREDVWRLYKLSFLSCHRDMVVEDYLPHVLKEGERIKVERRQQKLYMNNGKENGRGGGGATWSHVLFEHPTMFRMLAMDLEKKQEIVHDLIAFSKAEDYYSKIGKAWKRGYLLYGQSGMGKSTMITTMANLLDYDVYDLELTAVKDNTELRKLLVETTSKSIVVIEDIDYSLDLTRKRAGEKKPCKEKEDGEGEKKMMKGKSIEEDGVSKVTLFGLLNFINGCGWLAGASKSSSSSLTTWRSWTRP